MISRRAFLIGLGSIVTSRFVAQAKAHVHATGQPLLIQPARAEETLYLYEGFGSEEGDWGYRYRASLGPDEDPAPPPPTWREHLEAQGWALSTPADYDRLLRERGLRREDLDARMSRGAWEEHWDYAASPQARAYQLLHDLRLDCDPEQPGHKAGGIAFTDGGGHPGSVERWANLKDDLSVSILQARITERALPIRLVMASL